MAETLKRMLLELLAVPPEPEASAGTEGSLRVFRAAPAYFRYQLIAWFLRQLPILVGITALATAAIVGLSEAEIGGAPAYVGIGALALIASMVVIIAGYLIVRLDYELRWYKVTDRSLRIREGVIRVREMTMTFANIQNITITQGPLQRLFGIADLRVQTAGGGAVGPEQPGVGFGMHVGLFRGVDDAAGIRDLMLARLRVLEDAGLGDHDDVDDDGGVIDGVVGEAELLAALAGVRDQARALRRAAAGERSP